MRPTFVAWAAGFFDGEGCVTIQRRRYRGRTRRPFLHRLRVNASNNDRRALDLLAEQWGGTVNRHRDACYQWTLAEGGVERFLVDVSPYLVTKREQADLALDYIATCRRPRGTAYLSDDLYAQRETFYLRMQALKDEFRKVAA